MRSTKLLPWAVSLVFLLFFLQMSLSANATPWSWEKLNSSVNLRSGQLSGDVGQTTGNQYFAEFEMEYRDNEVGDLEKDFLMAARINDENQLMYSVQEVSLSRTHFRSELQFGRFILHWSNLDADWGLGKINNRRNFEFFRPGQEGLTGASYKHRWLSGVGLEVFGSLVYVPEMNPSLDINAEEKTIDSKNAWSVAPPASADISFGGIDQSLPVRYYIDYPEIANIVLRYSLGARLSFEKGPIDVGAFFLKKPENQLSIGAGASYRPGEADSGQIIKVNISPEVFYHDVYGGEVRYNYNNYLFTASFLSIYPNSFPDGDEFITRNLDLKTEKIKERFGGIGFQRTSDFLTFGVNYVARLSDFNGQTDFLAQNPRWNQAVNTFVSARFSRHFRMYADLKYDTLTYDRLAYVDLNYIVDKDWQLMAGVEVIGSPLGDETFWSDFRDNDSLYMGMKYVF